MQKAHVQLKRVSAFDSGTDDDDDDELILLPSRRRSAATPLATPAISTPTMDTANSPTKSPPREGTEQGAVGDEGVESDSDEEPILLRPAGSLRHGRDPPLVTPPPTTTAMSLTPTGTRLPSAPLSRQPSSLSLPLSRQPSSQSLPLSRQPSSLSLPLSRQPSALSRQRSGLNTRPIIDCAGQPVPPDASVVVNWHAGFHSLAYARYCDDEGEIVLDVAVATKTDDAPNSHSRRPMPPSYQRARYKVAASAVTLVVDCVATLERVCARDNLCSIARAAGRPVDGEALAAIVQESAQCLLDKGSRVPGGDNARIHAASAALQTALCPKRTERRGSGRGWAATDHGTGGEVGRGGGGRSDAAEGDLIGCDTSELPVLLPGAEESRPVYQGAPNLPSNRYELGRRMPGEDGRVWIVRPLKGSHGTEWWPCLPTGEPVPPKWKMAYMKSKRKRQEAVTAFEGTADVAGQRKARIDEPQRCAWCEVEYKSAKAVAIHRHSCKARPAASASLPLALPADVTRGVSVAWQASPPRKVPRTADSAAAVAAVSTASTTQPSSGGGMQMSGDGMEMSSEEVQMSGDGMERTNGATVEAMAAATVEAMAANAPAAGVSETGQALAAGAPVTAPVAGAPVAVEALAASAPVAGAPAAGAPAAHELVGGELAASAPPAPELAARELTRLSSVAHQHSADAVMADVLADESGGEGHDDNHALTDSLDARPLPLLSHADRPSRAACSDLAGVGDSGGLVDAVCASPPGPGEGTGGVSARTHRRDGVVWKSTSSVSSDVDNDDDDNDDLPMSQWKLRPATATAAAVAATTVAATTVAAATATMASAAMIAAAPMAAPVLSCPDDTGLASMVPEERREVEREAQEPEREEACEEGDWEVPWDLNSTSSDDVEDESDDDPGVPYDSSLAVPTRGAEPVHEASAAEQSLQEAPAAEPPVHEASAAEQSLHEAPFHEVQAHSSGTDEGSVSAKGGEPPCADVYACVLEAVDEEAAGRPPNLFHVRLVDGTVRPVERSALRATFAGLALLCDFYERQLVLRRDSIA